MLQFSTTYRNAFLNQIPSVFGGSEIIKVWTSTVPGNCASAETGTLLATWNLGASNDWALASGGLITLNGLPLATTASGNGTAGYFRHYDQFGTCHMQGTVTATGGGGDFTLANIFITTGLAVTITAYTLVAPGA